MSPIIITPQNTINVDETSREKIISQSPFTNYLDKNLFVIAGAGSGKTFMLVNRMVKMVESGIDVSKICAITFTKKAAAEFLDRFQRMLKDRSTVPDTPSTSRRPGYLPDPTSVTAARCIDALKNIDLCFTGTIDSFCNLVLSEYPNNAGIPSSSVVVMDDELMSLCKKEYKEIAKTTNPVLKNKFETFNLLFSNAPEVFAKSIGDVMDYSHIDIKYNVPTIDAQTKLDDLAKKYRQDILDDLDTISKQKANLPNVPSMDDAFNEFMQEYDSLKNDWTLSGISLFKKYLKEKVEKLRFISQPDFKFFDTVIKTKRAPFPDTYVIFKDGKDSFVPKNYVDFEKEVDELVYQYAIDFLVAARDEIRKRLKAQGKLSFSEYLITFRDVVKDDMKHGMHLINHIRSKHKYFLLDESQDTSPVQTELFLYLCSSVPATSLTACKPEPGSLFIVGDPKQSIYGFRGADVKAYLNTRDLFENVYDQSTHEVIKLTKNFRSTYELCDYFNAQFNKMDHFDPIPVGPGSDIILPDSSIAKTVLSGVYQCDGYLEAIKRLVGKHYIFDKGTIGKTTVDGKRIIEYKDIMLLGWTTGKHKEALDLLTANNIPVYCEGKFSFKGCDIMQTIYAFLLYIADEPGAFENVLASPLIGLDAKDFPSIPDIDSIPDANKVKLLNDIAALKNSNDSPIILFEKLIRVMKTYEYIDFANIEYVLFVLEKLKDAYNSGSISDFESMITFIKDFLDKDIDRCMNLEAKPNAVFLSNVHKVKGLERPIVILIDSRIDFSKKPNNDGDYQKNEAYIFKTCENKNPLTRNSWYSIDSKQLYASQLAAAIQKKDEENERLAYVAVTRARNVLVLPQNPDNNSVWKKVYPSKLLDIPVIQGNNPTPTYVSSFNSVTLPSFNVKATYTEMSPSKIQQVQSKQSVNQVSAGQVNVAQANNDAGLKGTIAHRLMQMLVNSKGQINKQQMIDTILNEFYLDKGSVYETLLNKVYDTMTSGGFPNQPDKGVPQDLLKELSQADEVYCEYPYSFKDNDEVWQGTIDLLYVKGGKYYIIDYKTDANTTNIVANHIMQLEAYKKAIKLFNGVDADAHIYHIDIK